MDFCQSSPTTNQIMNLKYSNSLNDLSKDVDAIAQATLAREQSAALDAVRDDARAWQRDFATTKQESLHDRMKEFEEKSVESRRVAHQLRELRRLADIASRTRHLDAVVTKGDFVLAAKLSVELRELPRVKMPFVNEDVAKRCDAVVQRIDETFAQSFVDISSERWIVTSSSSSFDIIEAVIALKEFDTHCARIVKRLMRTIVPRIVTQGVILEISLKTLTVKNSPQQRNNNLSNVLDSIRLLVEFIRSTLPNTLVDALLLRLAPELVDALAPLLDFEQFAQQRDLVQQFERNVYAVGLSARLVDGEQRYAARLHATALELARSALSASTYPNPLETIQRQQQLLDKEIRVAAPLNGASPWRVSNVAHRLLDQISAGTTTTLALDLITLYTAMIRLRASQIAAVPAQTLLLLADVQFVARRVRAFAAQSIAIVMQLHSLEIEADLVFDAACTAQCAAIDESWADSEHRLQRIELQLSRLALALNDTDVGPRNACTQLMSRTLRHVVIVASNSVLARKDISADECTSLHSSLTPFVNTIERYGDVDKLRAIVDVLPMNIVQIHAALPRLRKSLAKEELANLVRAMFQDSEKRTKLLNAL
jgi:hypothetical protein